jgi:thiamine biosynthesis lipoprotein
MIRRLAGLALILSWGAIASAAEFRVGQPVMGTILDVTVIAADEETARRAAAAAVDAVKRWDDVLTTWRPEGELAKLNQAAGSGLTAISAELHAALAAMLRLSAETNGAFDPGVGPLVNLWRENITGTDSIANADALSIRTALSLAPRRAALARGAALDPGAIGKGIGLDAAAKVLRKAEVKAAFLDFGGSGQIAIGAPSDSPAGWPVAVTGLAAAQVRGVVALRDAALSTSRTGVAGAAEGAIVDPRTGRPVARPRVATVRAGSAADADAWSTALVVLGSEGVPQARKAGLDVFLEDSEVTVEEPEFVEVPK